LTRATWALDRRPCFVYAAMERALPWSGGLASVQLAPAPSFNNRVLAGRSLAGLGKAPLARPMRPKTRCFARSSKLFRFWPARPWPRP